MFGGRAIQPNSMAKDNAGTLDTDIGQPSRRNAGCQSDHQRYPLIRVTKRERLRAPTEDRMTQVQTVRDPSKELRCRIREPSVHRAASPS